MPYPQREAIRRRVSQIVALELPAEDIEFVSEAKKQALAERLRAAKEQLEALQVELGLKGYPRAATYLRRARDQLFNCLRLWLRTGIVAPQTTSIVENLIRELVRRLKKLGWNWSDAGAERMGRFVMIRRYDEQGWKRYSEKRMNLRGRCQITLRNYCLESVA